MPKSCTRSWWPAWDRVPGTDVPARATNDHELSGHDSSCSLGSFQIKQARQKSADTLLVVPTPAQPLSLYPFSTKLCSHSDKKQHSEVARSIQSILLSLSGQPAVPSKLSLPSCSAQVQQHNAQSASTSATAVVSPSSASTNLQNLHPDGCEAAIALLRLPSTRYQDTDHQTAAASSVKNKSGVSKGEQRESPQLPQQLLAPSPDQQAAFPDPGSATAGPDRSIASNVLLQGCSRLLQTSLLDQQAQSAASSAHPTLNSTSFVVSSQQGASRTGSIFESGVQPSACCLKQQQPLVSNAAFRAQSSSVVPEAACKLPQPVPHESFLPHPAPAQASSSGRAPTLKATSSSSIHPSSLAKSLTVRPCRLPTHSSPLSSRSGVSAWTSLEAYLHSISLEHQAAHLLHSSLRPRSGSACQQCYQSWLRQVCMHAHAHAFVGRGWALSLLCTGWLPDQIQKLERQS